jgi:hypothetical protein
MMDKNEKDLIPRVTSVEGTTDCSECGAQIAVVGDAEKNMIPCHCANCGADYVMEFVFARRYEGDPNI